MAIGVRDRVLWQAAVALVALVVGVVVADAAAVVEVYRMIQYDLRGVPLGSRRAAMNHHASSNLAVPGSDLSRTVIILPIAEANITMLNEYLQTKRLLGGLLLLFPHDYGSPTDSDSEGDGDDDYAVVRKHIAEVEQWLIHNNLPYPVYFAYEDENLINILKEVVVNDAAGRPATAMTGGYKLVIPVADAKKLPPPTITNIQGWLPGLRAEGDNSILPTIAIVASYDTFGAAPALSVGSDNSGSGVTALLELARLFSRLYANPKTRGPYNLLFGLTAGGPYNYNGTNKWLRNFDQRIRESMEYALCLNTIGSSSNQLWLHVSKPPDNVFIKQIHSEFVDVAEGLDLSVELRHKKINISNPRVAWEHEQFSRQRITAATLSQLETAPELFQHTGGISDSRRMVNETTVGQNIKLVAESLARHIYKQQGKQIEVFAEGSSLAVNPAYVRAWLDLLSRTPRVAPFLGKNAPIVSAFYKELAEHTMDVSYHHDTLDSTFVFYDLTKAQLSVHQVASVTFDLFVMLAVGVYLGLLFLILLVTTKGFDDLIGALRRPPSRKVKST
ncbi:unnamed protein product [Sphagnum tenellum]